MEPLCFPGKTIQFASINVLSLYLSDIGRKKRIHHDLPGIHPFNHILFADDMTLLAQDSVGMQILLNAIQEFEE